MAKVLNYIHIKNMFVHKNKRIEFSEGKNYIIGSIGTGKTLINEAIAFCFFGTVALRGKASSYKNLEVELSFNYHDEVFLIKRLTGDATLLMLDKTTGEYGVIANSTSIVNQKIISLFGYNYDIYLLSNYCKQKKLSYFSDMLPSKRLQYIDKISGIDESKELTAWLTAKRKVLKENMSLLKDMINKPKLSDNVNLEFNYEANIKNLSEKLSSINDLYALYNEYNSKSINKNHEPILGGHEIEITYGALTVEDVKQCILYIEELDKIQTQVQILENKVKDLPTLNKKYENFTLEQVNSILDNYNLNLIKNLSDNIKINCPCCEQSIVLNKLVDSIKTQDEHINLKDLYNIQDYFIKDIDSQKKQLTRQISKLEKEFGDLVTKAPVKDIWKIDKNVFLSRHNNGKRLLEKYNRDVEEYQKSKNESLEFVKKASLVKAEIDKFLEEQSKLIELKDSYIKAATEKELFLEQFSIYEQSIVKYNQFVIEYKLVNSLIKDVVEITNLIKSQTIPLINYHASRYLNLMTKGVMTKIEITDDYNLIVDGSEINLKSGGQQDLASLAFRLSLGQSIITGMLPLFLGDEIDSAGTSDLSNDISDALDTMSANGYQIILVTHSDTTNIENKNIIQL